MKNNFFKILIVCFLTNIIYGQQVNNTGFKTKTLQVYQNLDKSRIPHGILLDFGMEFTNLKAFNGVLTDSTTTTSQTLSDIYKTLLMCRVRQVTTGFITPEEYATRWFTQRTNGVIILSGQYFKYNRFADDAYPSRLNYSANKFSDKFVGTVWQNPYEEKQLFAMASAVAKYKGLNFKVKLPTNLFLSNYPASIQNIQVDFSDGLGFRVVGYDQLINVNYAQPNTYNWTYKITLNNGQTMLSQSKVTIEKGLNAIPINTNPALLQSTATTLAVVNPPPANLSAYYKTTISSTIQYLGYNAIATVYIRYANGGNTITKPLIVTEGFDDGVILHPEQEAGSNTIDDFFSSVNISNSDLTAEITSYDVIYVDWNNGVTFLQRNAYVLEEVIKWVNQNKTTTTQNVVLGQSMGGLIARYALKDMENRGLPHDTRLYVSHDAPHLGANTPVSAQIAARHLRNIYVSTPIPFALGEIIIPLAYNFAEGFSSIINLFGGNTSVQSNITPLQAFSLADVPATRQMSYNWVNSGYGINNVIHDAWQSELAQKGYPLGTNAKPIRNIAIANGSECGITQTDNGNILSYYSESSSPYNFFGILDALIGVGLTNPAIIITALLPGSSYWKSDFQCKYVTNLNQNKNIYHGYLGYKKKVFYFIPVSIAVADLDINQPTGLLPFDIYSGGQIRTPTNSFPINGIVSNTFGFIPTASSLDIGKYITPINDSDYRRSFVGAQPPIAPKNSPFQNFVTGFVQNNPTASNSRHISFNRRNGDWLKKELNPTPTIPIEYTDCSFICSDAQITGPNVLCTNAIYTAPSIVQNYNWTITKGANLVTMTGNGTKNITLTALPNVSGAVTFSLTLGDDGSKCGSATLTKTIWIGKPTINALVQTPMPTAASWDLDLNTNNIQNITDISYTKISGNGIINVTGSYCEVTGSPTVAWTVTLQINITNACGTTTITKNYSNPDPDHNPHTSRVSNQNIFKIYPNPATNIVNIDLKDQNEKPSSNSIIIAQLFNMMGEVKGNVTITNNIASINTLGLPKGIYVLKIKVEGETESHQVAIE